MSAKQQDPDAAPRCPGCGYSLYGLNELRCPECGNSIKSSDELQRARWLASRNEPDCKAESFRLRVALTAWTLLALGAALCAIAAHRNATIGDLYFCLG